MCIEYVYAMIKLYIIDGCVLIFIVSEETIGEPIPETVTGTSI